MAEREVFRFRTLAKAADTILVTHPERVYALAPIAQTLSMPVDMPTVTGLFAGGEGATTRSTALFVEANPSWAS